MTARIYLLLIVLGLCWQHMVSQCCSDVGQACLSKQERAKLYQLEAKNIAMLAEIGIVPSKRQPPIQGTLIWPMQNKDGLPDNDFKTWYVSNQVDLDMNIDTSVADTAILDYNCGMRSYDTDPSMSNPSGYNHDGTDIVIYPHPYIKMSTNAVEVIAAAEGVIVAKVDTNVDMNCVWGTGRPSNNLTLLHDDGSKTRYVHLKQFSLTAKEIGDTIVQGEFIGIVGSSGNSTIPHLHFEVENPSGTVIDPFFGPCSDTSLTTATWWQNQVPYVDSTLNKLMTYTTKPGNPGCDMADSTGVASVVDERILFAAEDSVWMSMFFTHVDENDTAHLYIRKPDNTLLWDTGVGMPSDFDKAYKQSYFYVLGANPDFGEYEIEVIFMGESFTHNFIVAECPPSYILSGNVSSWQYWQAQDWITSDAILQNFPSTDVTYKAGDFIEFEIGFDSEVGAKLIAQLAGCGNEGN